MLLLAPDNIARRFAVIAGALVLSLAIALYFMRRAPRLSTGFAGVTLLVAGCSASYGVLALIGAIDQWGTYIPSVQGSAYSEVGIWLDWVTRPSPRSICSVTALLVSAFASLVILFDVNSSALLRHYRAALERAFLEPPIERAERKWPELTIKEISPNQRPFHLVNATVNAWSLVDATSAFTFSPLFCGMRPVKTDGSYRVTGEYMGGRLSLAIALEISGAAVSPNTTGFGGTLGFILGLANARLGQWLGNPEHSSTWQSPSPWLGGTYWFRELFGRKRENAPYLYVSDGGHFENIGIYELVARRCRLIVAVDAGADPDFTFEDLANAVRRCSTGISVDISIDCGPVMPRHGGRADQPWALGRITYPEGASGLLLYVKAILSGDEPIDVFSYALQHPAFPHESTTDQFFDEAQFESYRRLGLHIGTRTLEHPMVTEALASVLSPLAPS